MLGLKKSLMLLGAFSFGYNAAHAIHELGHALAMWATGDSVTGISLHPFSWSHISYGAPPTCPLLIAWAGVVFASSCGLLLLVVIRPWRGAWTVPLAMMGLCTLVVNGLYLTVDSLFLAGGDATCLVLHGTPRSFVLLTGVGLTALGLAVGHLLNPRFGLTATDGVVSRIAILEGGIGPYLIAMLVYQVCWNQSEITLWLAYVITGLLILAGGAVGSRFIEKWWNPEFRYAPLTPSWSTAGGCLVAGGVVLAVEIMAYR
jgi:Peptidase M50B-like